MKKIKLKYISVGMLLPFLVVAFYNGLVIRKYAIKTDKLKTNQSVRIVLISDLHSHIYGKDQSKIASKIKKQKPDIIALAGDIADDWEPIEGTRLFLEAIKDIAPVYYVTGNHEFRAKDIENIKNTFRDCDIEILENSYKTIVVNGVEITIGGVADPDIMVYETPKLDWHKEVLSSFLELENKSNYKILLSHRPEEVEFYKKLPFDMVLSGHAHGGQVRIPFLLNGLLSPNQGWFPKYAGGIYIHKEYTHVVSRGVSFHLKRPRIFNPPEIVVIDVDGIG